MKLKYVIIGIFAISLANNSLSMEVYAVKSDLKTKTSLVERLKESQKPDGELSLNDFSLIKKN